MKLNGHDITKGVNINDAHAPFTALILSGMKTVETRNSKSLHSLVGQRVALIRTGLGPAEIVGTAVIWREFEYRDRDCFDEDIRFHLVDPQSPYHISRSKTGKKYGYSLSEVEALPTPIPCTSKGIVIRNL